MSNFAELAVSSGGSPARCAREIEFATGSKDVAVYIQAAHGCCENRGIMAHSSLTQTTVLRGAFKADQSVKKEFFDNIKLQQDFAPR